MSNLLTHLIPIGAANLKMFMNAVATAPEWAAGIKIGTFTRLMDAASGDVSYTSVGFKPSSIILFANYQGTFANGSISVGIDDGTAHYSVGIGNQTYGVNLTQSIDLFYQTSHQTCFVKTFDSDGFTLTWTLVGAGINDSGYILYTAHR